MVMETGAFVRYRDDKPMGGLAPAYYEAVTMGVHNAFDKITERNNELVKKVIVNVLQSAAFKENTGSSANTKPKLNQRIKLVTDALFAC